MQIADDGTTPRNAFVSEQFGAAESPLLAELNDRFMVRVFRFSSDVSRLSDAGELTYDGTSTRLTQALNGVREELAGVPLSGLVVVSDGVSAEDTRVAESLLPLQAAGVPVYTVGLGENTLTAII